MKFSLITATLGRIDEIKILCESLNKQTFTDFELYIVDQNEHHLIEEYINKINVFYPIHYIRNKTKGLSLNRNIALKHCKGDYIGFPDDDCFYSPHVLEEVNKAFLQFNAAKFIAVTTCDSITHEQNHFTKKQFLFKKDIFRNCISYNIFVKKNSNLFDERLGVGTYFSSGEETDYLYSLITSKSDYGIFVPQVQIFHPTNQNHISLQKVYKYSLGFAALQKKDWLTRKDNSALYRYFYYLSRAFIGMLLIKGFFKHWYSFKGKIVGFVKFKV